MNSEKLKIPKKLKVGFQERSDTYTGRLAYVVYQDDKGKIAKEKSWTGWKDPKIPVKDYPNDPTSGFVLNKKVGDHNSGWNHRQGKCRVFDPRGFEFEISFENLLYILQECDCTKGKGLEGEFVYSWSGPDLVLLPVHSPDYKNSLAFAEKVKKEKVTAKSLKKGYAYKGKEADNLVYIGKLDWWNDRDPNIDKEYYSVPLHTFYHKESKTWYGYKNFGSWIHFQVDETPALGLPEVEDMIDQWKGMWIGHGSEGVTELGVMTVENDGYVDTHCTPGEIKNAILKILGTPAFRTEKNEEGETVFLSNLPRDLNYNYGGCVGTFKIFHRVKQSHIQVIYSRIDVRWNGQTMTDYLEQFPLACPVGLRKSPCDPNGYAPYYDPWTEEEVRIYEESVRKREEEAKRFKENATFELSRYADKIENYYLDKEGHLNLVYLGKTKLDGDSSELLQMIQQELTTSASRLVSPISEVGVVIGGKVSRVMHFYSNTARKFNY